MNIINIKSKEEINKIKLSGKLAFNVLNMIKDYIKPNVSTGYLDDICNEYIINVQNAYPGSLGYLGFPNSICTSVNEVVCHGIPSYKKILKDGDIINIDVVVLKDGFYGDTSKMFFVGKPTILSKRLCYVAEKSLDLAINILKPGLNIKYIGKTIQNFVEKNNFSIVRDYCGHGIGRKLHEFPQILHYSNNNNFILTPGISFTIEPMINSGSNKVKLMNDGWTVKTKDHSLSAQYEHTIIITNNSYEVITI
ncbi:methionine aminopeptidase [endosymbiont of Sipalinus gigas]|uniref:type I methionyl aminopeptidase n=1 Tax=endosymbiont of Sipalinus gigas TaxID=1972134 RepID=UPI000DC71A81|nr:type I methionyl aminopeptidase [endosymbiont of Sipalinus gigas]BBA85293.1 methionine aminopeptidase [endosymbiont of Sipalinus gigas]